jgi:hypothetical protein
MARLKLVDNNGELTSFAVSQKSQLRSGALMDSSGYESETEAEAISEVKGRTKT